MFDNYPPGVSGNEDAFGPQSEETFEDQDINCPACGTDVRTDVVRLTWNYTVEAIFDCPACGAEEVTVQVEAEEPDYGDPDEVFDFYGEDY